MLAGDFTHPVYPQLALLAVRFLVLYLVFYFLAFLADLYLGD